MSPFKEIVPVYEINPSDFDAWVWRMYPATSHLFRIAHNGGPVAKGGTLRVDTRGPYTISRTEEIKLDTLERHGIAGEGVEVAIIKDAVRRGILNTGIYLVWGYQGDQRRKTTTDEVTVIVKGGTVQEVKGTPSGMTVRIEDYDIGSSNTGKLSVDDDGDFYYETVYGGTSQ